MKDSVIPANAGIQGNVAPTLNKLCCHGFSTSEAIATKFHDFSLGGIEIPACAGMPE